MRIRYKGEGREEQGRISGTDEAKRKRKEETKERGGMEVK